ncbi:MAG: hypothetical protein ABIS50_00515 [Luteolibacter sp.]|uniref:hypothetical protein n=1 Tax=Luteolibacter sp. TaxID=1962973 RepID=UPI00326467B1
MSWFAPDLIPARHMIDALISPNDFQAAITKLEPRLSTQLIYVREEGSVIVSPLFHLSEVEAKAKSLKKKNPGYAEYLSELAREWTSIIARAAIDHPRWRDLFAGIPKALKGELPSSPPAWTKYFHRTLITGRYNMVDLPSYPHLTLKDTDGGRWGASSEVATDLYTVLEALGYGPRPKGTRGPKPN